MSDSQAKTTTVLLCGVGGQGTILAADVLAKVAAASGLEVKLSEIHGMSQRGGSVTTVVRFGSEVSTMVCDLGSADCIVAFEEVEALRNLPFLRRGGRLLVNAEAIPSLPVQIGAAAMPEAPEERLEAAGATLIPAGAIARAQGNPKGMNVALVGALSTALPFAEQTWADVISKRVPPKTIDANIKTFEAGRAAAR
ncbi:MAG: indolepyruvate oxidoreductase subunit beta [Atopobiaceae bacterium]|jgi:indolepyruvate ferredoxin oxidoreductase beta subunit|nr:indolepyruvate oxidoreductase subunit beta [Atopobiaceae bacterium]